MHSTLADFAQLRHDPVASSFRPRNLHGRCRSWRRLAFVVDGKNNCNLLWLTFFKAAVWECCHFFGLPRRPSWSPWWYMIPLGRRANYKLGPLGIGGAHHLKALCLCVRPARKHCYPNCQSHFQKSWWGIGLHTHTHADEHVHTAAARTDMFYHPHDKVSLWISVLLRLPPSVCSSILPSFGFKRTPYLRPWNYN